MAEWLNRIVGHGEESPEQLAANPKNWRIHPQQQQRVLEGAINDVGYLRSVTVNKRTGYVLDGHLRVSLALSSGQQSIPVEYVELSEAEEAEALATLDPIAGMAVADHEQLGALIADIRDADVAVAEMLGEMYEIPNFEPVSEDEQGRLDEKAKVSCPECGHEFTPWLV
jgi:ParB-like chromosome segregation protein Spo0J